MATCIRFEVSGSGAAAASSATGERILPWAVGEAAFSGGEYSCPQATHLIMTIGEINAMPKSGVPDAALMRESFFMSFGLVLSCYLIGKLAGAVLHVIRRG